MRSGKPSFGLSAGFAIHRHGSVGDHLPGGGEQVGVPVGGDDQFAGLLAVAELEVQPRLDGVQVVEYLVVDGIVGG
jgi:hypothetical protein